MANRQTTHPLELPATLAALFAILGGLFLYPASQLGFWEPWETPLATLGRALGESDTMSVFAPVGDAYVMRPWLETALLRIGYMIGDGSEFAFRLPFAILLLLAAAFVTVALRPFFGTVRAGLVALLFGLAPAVSLSGVFLAGDATSIAPITVATLALGVVMARRGVGAAWMLPIAGVALALSVWGRGAMGFAVPVSAAALFAVGARERADVRSWSPLWLIPAGACFLVLVAYPLWQVTQSSWEESKNLFGAGLAVGLPLTLLIAAAPGGRGRFLADPIGGPIALVLFAALVWWPWSVATGIVGQEQALASMLYETTFNEFMLQEHVTYDVLVRLLGASIYPTTILLPIAFAYLLKTSDPEHPFTDDADDGARALKQFFVLWTGAGVGLVGLSASLNDVYFAPVVLPMVAGGALALSDRRFMAWLAQQRLALAAAGVACAVLLAVTSKDMLGVFDEDKGRPGPHFFFEFLLLDGEVSFPADYAFDFIQRFFQFWFLLLAILFFRPFDLVINAIERVNTWVAGALDRRGGVSWRARLLPRGASKKLTAMLMRWVPRLRLADSAWTDSERRWTAGRIGITVFAILTATWAVELSVVDVPEVNNHFSQRGLLDTFDRLAPDGAVLHTAGVGRNDTSYYMSGRDVAPLDRISDIRELFCESETAEFVIVPVEDLDQAHYHVRHAEGGRRGEVENDEGCEAGADLFVVDGRSSRYALLSNRLPAGEEDQSPIAAHVFTVDTLPDDAQPPHEEVTLDGKLRLVAVDIHPRTLGSGDLTVAAFWEVIERPSGSFEVFIHGDQGGNRLNGDHDPVDGLYDTRWWVPGEVVRDEFVIDVSSTDKSGEYIMWYGFFRGDDRMQVDPPRGDNRVNLGTVTVN